jgi:dipeptidyl aminopeptidase/acylaminoacyl peptidase
MNRKKLYIALTIALSQVSLMPVFRATPALAQSSTEAKTASPFEINAADMAPYLDFKSTTLLGWHPITKQALVRTNNANSARTGQQLQLVEGAGGKLTPLTAEPADSNISALLAQQHKIGHAWFEPRVGSYIIFEKIDGNKAQLFRLDLATKVETAMSPADQHAGNIVFNRAGSLFAYTTQSAASGSTSVYVGKLPKLGAQRLLATLKGAGYSDFNFAPDDKSLVYVQSLAQGESHVWHLDIASGSTKRLTPAPSDALKTPYYWASPRHSADGKSLFLICNLDSDFKRFCKLDLSTGKVAFLSKFAFDIDAFLISERQNRIALITNEPGGNGLRFLDLSTFKELPRPPLLLGEISGLHWRGALDEDDSEGVDGIEANKKPFSAKTELGFTLASARGPEDVFTAQVGGRISRWTNSASANLNPMDFVEPQSIAWKSVDQTTITGFYYAPDKTKFPGKRPVIIKLPDDNLAQFKPGFIGRDNYFINVLGIAVIYPNIRGSKGFGKAFLNAGKNRAQENAMSDIGALLDWVATQPALDAERIMFSEASIVSSMGAQSVITSNVLAQAIAKRYADKIVRAADIKNIADSM